MNEPRAASTDLPGLRLPEAPPQPAGLHVRILDAGTAGDLQAWLDLWHRWPGREVMAHPSYVRLYARPQDRVLAAVVPTARGGILYPFIARPLSLEAWSPPDLDAWDTTTAYGYGGPFAWNVAPEETIDFWPQFERWARQEHVVTSFARLSLFADQILPFDGMVEIDGPNIVRSLTDPEDRIWASYEPKVRKNVRRARERGCSLLVDTTGAYLEEFHRVYTATMQRRQASSQYFYPRSFFESLIRGLEGRFVFFHVRLHGKVVSTELVLLSERHAYSFLGGTLEEAFDARPNDFLKHESFLWCRSAGKTAVVLGGAYRGQEGLLRYKSAFAPLGSVPFAVGKKAYDAVLTGTLQDHRAEWVRLQGLDWRREPGFFPPYRA